MKTNKKEFKITKEINKVNYEADKLDRKEFCEDLAKYIIKTDVDEKPCCISLRGRWGTGKSWALGKVKEELEYRDDNILVVNYDSWKNNFYEEPLIPMMFCILKEIYNKGHNQDSSFFNITKEVFKSLAKGSKYLFYGFTKFMSMSLIDFKAIAEFSDKELKRMQKEIDKTNNDIFTEYKNIQLAIEELKCVIEKIVSKKLKIVIIIDELDRCASPYSIKVLERLHHVINSKGVVSLVSINDKVIKNSVEHTLGKVEAEQYLRKIFNKNVILPTGTIENFKRHYIDDHFRKYLSLKDQKRLEDKDISDMYYNMLVCDNISLRDIEKKTGEMDDIIEDYFSSDLLSISELIFIISVQMIEEYIRKEDKEYFANFIDLMSAAKIADVKGNKFLVDFFNTTRIKFADYYVFNYDEGITINALYHVYFGGKYNPHKIYKALNGHNSSRGQYANYNEEEHLNMIKKLQQKIFNKTYKKESN